MVVEADAKPTVRVPTYLYAYYIKENALLLPFKDSGEDDSGAEFGRAVVFFSVALFL